MLVWEAYESARVDRSGGSCIRWEDESPRIGRSEDCSRERGWEEEEDREGEGDDDVFGERVR